MKCSRCPAEADGHTWCRDCRREYDRRRYQEMKSQRLAQVRARNKENRSWVQEQKRGPCTDCGNSYPPEIMHFDHLPEFEKRREVSAMLALSREVIAEEIGKCELVCPTCHALRTLNRRGVV